MNDLLDTVCFVCRGRNNGITAQGTWREHAVSARHAEVCVGSDIWESHIKISAKTCIVAARTAVRAHTYIHTYRQMGGTGEQEGRRQPDIQRAGRWYVDGQRDRQYVDRLTVCGQTDSSWTGRQVSRRTHFGGGQTYRQQVNRWTERQNHGQTETGGHTD